MRLEEKGGAGGRDYEARAEEALVGKGPVPPGRRSCQRDHMSKRESHGCFAE